MPRLTPDIILDISPNYFKRTRNDLPIIVQPKQTALVTLQQLALYGFYRFYGINELNDVDAFEKAENTLHGVGQPYATYPTNTDLQSKVYFVSASVSPNVIRIYFPKICAQKSFAVTVYMDALDGAEWQPDQTGLQIDPIGDMTFNNPPGRANMNYTDTSAVFTCRVDIFAAIASNPSGSYIQIIGPDGGLGVLEQFRTSIWIDEVFKYPAGAPNVDINNRPP